MRTVGTHFEQVPKTVVEKILAQQVPPPENELAGDAAVSKRAISKAASKTPSGDQVPQPKR